MQTDETPKSRDLNWENCVNTRDLGGLPTADGGRTRWGAVIRSDLLGRLNEKGKQALVDYGVRTIIDVRAPFEVVKDPSIFMEPGGDPGLPVYQNLPVEKLLPEVSALVMQAKTRGEAYCIILDHYPDCAAAIMRAVANARPGGVAIHCLAGKDRTGMMSALLLGMAGVPAEYIVEDYALSQVRLGVEFEHKLMQTTGEHIPDLWASPSATADKMSFLLAHLEERYGGVPGYLAQAGMQPEELAQLKRRLAA